MTRDPILLLLLACIVGTVICLWSLDLHRDEANEKPLFRYDWSGKR